MKRSQKPAAAPRRERGVIILRRVPAPLPPAFDLDAYADVLAGALLGVVARRREAAASPPLKKAS